jgi:hypothetical protein
MPVFKHLTPLGKLVAGTILLALVVLGGFFWLNGYIYQEKQGPQDHKDATYIFSGEPVTLQNGVGKTTMTLGQEGMSTIRYFGNEAKGDIDGDGIVDLVFLMTQETSDGKTYFYLVGAMQTEANTYNGTQAVLIGDRVAPQTTEFRDGLIIVNYADRTPGEPMTAQPSMGKSLYLKYSVDNNDFGEVVQNFEGEVGGS